MIQKIKKYLKTAGWLFLQPNVLAYDKQAHGIFALWLTFPTFYIPQTLGLTSLISTPISIALVALIGFGIEYYQKWFMPNRVFDVKDATIMIKLNIAFLILLSIRMLIIGTYTF